MVCSSAVVVTASAYTLDCTVQYDIVCVCERESNLHVQSMKTTMLAHIFILCWEEYFWISDH